jgi:SNF2 family DNA or RNA helicase
MSAPVYGEIHEDGKHILITVAGNDWDMQDAANLLNTMTANCAPIPTGEKRNGKDVHFPDRMLVPLTYANVTQLAALFPAGSRFGPDLRWTPGPKLMAWVLAEVIRRSCQGDFTGTPPKELTPMPHQRAGAIAAGMNGRFLFADEMRTGKTLTSLMSLAEMENRSRAPWPCAIVCPASVIDTWLEEIAQCYPQWAAVAYRGPNRSKWLKSDAKILVMSYETMRNDVGDTKTPGPLLRKKFGAVIADEAHMICNYTSQQSTRLRRLVKHTGNFIAATGTPITKNAGSFWPILNGMDPGSYPSRDRYKDRYCIPKGNAAYGDTEVGGLNPAMEPEFRIVMQGTWRRVATQDVVEDLPPKSYQTRWIDIPPKYRPAYDQMEEDMLAELPDNDTPLSAQSTLAKMMRLSQLAHSACDVRVWTEIETDESSKNYGQEVERTEVTPKLPCWKGDALLELLEEIHQGETFLDDGGKRRGPIRHGSRPLIAFAPLKQLVMLCGGMTERAGFKTGYIVGGLNNAQRTATKHAFQRNELDVLCVTTGAGGVGLTLNAAEFEAFVMRPWSFVQASQAEARGWGKGQTRSLQVVDFVAKKSIESRIRAALRDKAKNLSELVEDRRIVEELFGGHGKEH